MRVILEVVSGTMSGHKRMLRNNESMTVGRSALADFPIESDTSMSDRQFIVRADKQACHLDNLSASVTTSVNGKPSIERASLHHGDRIIAGETQFAVHIEGEQPRAAVIEPAKVVAPIEPIAPAGAPPAIKVSQPGSQPTSGTGAQANISTVPCELSMHPSNIRQYSAAVDLISATSIIQRLGVSFDHFFIVDTTKLDPQLCEKYSDAELLFSWLPKESITGQSPVIVSSDHPASADLVDDHWGTDTLVTVFWKQGEPAPLAQVQRCAGAYVSPSSLRPQLYKCIPEAAADLMSEIDLVLVESDSPDTWSIFSIDDQTSELTKVGLQPPVEPQPDADQSPTDQQG